MKLKKKTCAKTMFVLVLLGVVWYLFHDSFSSVLKELKMTSPPVVLLICLASLGYFLTEGTIFTIFSRTCNPVFSWRQGLACSYYTAFYRAATLGSGSAAACTYYLNRHGVEISDSFAISTLQYVLYKLSIAVISGLGFLFCNSFMTHYFGTYKTALLVGYALTALICAALLFICLSSHFHRALLWLACHLIKKEAYRNRIKESAGTCRQLRTNTRHLLKQKRDIVLILLLELLKLFFWYIIPYITIRDLPANIFETVCVTSLVFTLSGVIPAPGGLGSTEGLFILLFSQLTFPASAASSLVLYRLATYILPCLAGGILAAAQHRSKPLESGVQESVASDDGTQI